MTKMVTIEITDQGVKIETSGYVDQGCLKEVESLVKSLEKTGITVEVVKRDMKPEGYIPEKGCKNAVRR